MGKWDGIEEGEVGKEMERAKKMKGERSREMEKRKVMGTEKRKTGRESGK